MKGKYIDLTYLSTICDNDRMFMDDMIKTFLIESPQVITKLTESYKNNNRKGIKEAAHKFKSSLMFMGIQSLFSTIRDIENSEEKNINSDQLKNLIGQVENTCQEACTELQSFLDSGISE